MTTNISCRSFELTDAIREYIEEKTGHLQKLDDRITHIAVECDKNTHHQKGDVFHVRMNIEMPGEFLHAEAEQQSLNAAVDVCRDAVADQIRKLKEKRDDQRRQSRKTRRSLKSILTFWKSE